MEYKLIAAARLADRVGDAQTAVYRARAENVRANLVRRTWDEGRGLFRANPADVGRMDGLEQRPIRGAEGIRAAVPTPKGVLQVGGAK